MHTISWRRRLAAALVLPFLLVLAGCGKFAGEIQVKNVDELHVKFEFAVQKDQLNGLYSSADQLCKNIQSEGVDPTGDKVKLEPFEENGMLGCRAEGDSKRSDFSKSMNLTEKDGEYHLTMGEDAAPMSPSDLEQIEKSGFDFKLTFEFPGKVTASKSGTIEGNKVVYSSVSEFAKGVDITAKAGGFPWLIVVIAVLVLGFLLLVVAAIVAFFVIRSRKNKGPKIGGGSPYAANSAPMAPGAPGAPAAGGASVAGAPVQPSPYGQGSPVAPSAPQPGQAPSAPQPGQQPGGWGQPPQAPQQGQAPQAPQPGDQPGGWGQPPQGGQQPPQNPGW